MSSDNAMIRAFVGLALGLAFGLGLVISGMSDPQKVLNFLDITGNWDPSLIFVMAGASLTTLIGYRVIFKNQQPLFDSRFHKPTATDVDKRLVGGAVIFGIGWGLSGFCPGPAWTAVLLLQSGTMIFIPAMLVSMWFTSRYLSNRKPS